MKAFARVFGSILAMCLGLLAVAWVQRIAESTQLSNKSQEATLCGQMRASVGTSPETIKLTITPMPQDSSLVALYPDLEFMPLYPGSEIAHDQRNAEVHSANFEWVGMRSFTYLAPADLTKVVAFYREALSKNGWRPVSNPLPAQLPDTSTEEHRYFTLDPAYYTWTDPEDSTPWHFQLELSMFESADGYVWVSLDYGRHPDTIKNLPMYSGATNIQVTCAEESTFLNNQPPVTLITKTYVTDASPDQVADYYNSTLPQYAWSFHDDNMMDRATHGEDISPEFISSRQTGSISSGEGLYFVGRASYTEEGMVLAPELLITATRIDYGRTKIKLTERIVQRPSSGVTDRP